MSAPDRDKVAPLNGDVVSIGVGQSGLWDGNNNAARVTVFAPSGAQIASILQGLPTDVSLTETGTHVIQVHDINYWRTPRKLKTVT